MCTVTIDIDEKMLRDVNPNLSDIAAIREWAQRLIDCRIQEMVEEDDETISVEELRAMLHKTIHEEYAKPLWMSAMRRTCIRSDLGKQTLCVQRS